jgi:hypothetical protein
MLETSLRLNLRLVCNGNTSMKKTLDVWPCAFPIVITDWRSVLPLSGANVIATLEHHDRVSQIDLHITNTLLQQVYKVMAKPYPILTRLRFYTSESGSAPAPMLRDTFLGGSAPHLKYLELTDISFPALPKFLTFCHYLVNLQLGMIPNNGYISPEFMATALSAPTKLEYICIAFDSKSPTSFHGPTNTLAPPSSLTHVVLPALAYLEFHGPSEYFEDLVARIDTPAIVSIETQFSNHWQLDFDIPHFLQFIGRTQIPRPFEEANLYFGDEIALIYFGHRDTPERRILKFALSFEVSYHCLDSQVACLAQLCGKISPFLYNVQWLLITISPCYNVVFSDWKDYMNNPQWLEIFQAFPALQHMQIPHKLGKVIASALLEPTGEKVLDALPMLRHLYLPPPSASTQQAIEPFLFSRYHSNHPVNVHLTKMD